jgi:hypothetical protein
MTHDTPQVLLGATKKRLLYVHQLRLDADSHGKGVQRQSKSYDPIITYNTDTY